MARMIQAAVVLGMHRSGTSCIAGMFAAGARASAGRAVRNWDNARGHHEMLELVRLNEAVLAHSGGHWLSPPASVRWTDDHAAERDRLLREKVGGLPALLKDPRMLLVLPFWRAAPDAFEAIGVVRHPLAVARSLESWRGMPLAEGIALWTAHNAALEADRAQHGTAVIDFDRPDLVAAVAAALALDPAALAGAYERDLVHHDPAGAPEIPGLADALALYRRLAGPAQPVPHAVFPRAQLASVEHLLAAGDASAALAPARTALAAVADRSAVLVPLVTTLVRHRAFVHARTLIDEHPVDPALADLLRAKVLLASGDPASAVRHLEAACSVPEPLFQARHLLPQALRGAGRPAEARAALRAVAGEALYPHGPLATLAEWSWLDGDRTTALAEMADAIAAAPLHRRGRLRTRRAEWLLALGDPATARGELLRALDEDPGYERIREVLALTPG